MDESELAWSMTLKSKGWKKWDPQAEVYDGARDTTHCSVVRSADHDEAARTSGWGVELGLHSSSVSCTAVSYPLQHFTDKQPAMASNTFSSGSRASAWPSIRSIRHMSGRRPTECYNLVGKGITGVVIAILHTIRSCYCIPWGPPSPPRRKILSR